MPSTISLEVNLLPRQPTQNEATQIEPISLVCVRTSIITQKCGYQYSYWPIPAVFGMYVNRNSESQMVALVHQLLETNWETADH
jgi:hypothetical protein